MKHTLTFAHSLGTVSCRVSIGQIDLPVIPGILKHPAPDELPALLRKPEVARKYTILALEKCAWPVLRQFPADWLRDCLARTHMRPSRRNALLFLLS